MILKSVEIKRFNYLSYYHQISKCIIKIREKEKQTICIMNHE